LREFLIGNVAHDAANTNRVSVPIALDGDDAFKVTRFTFRILKAVE